MWIPHYDWRESPLESDCHFTVFNGKSKLIGYLSLYPENGQYRGKGYISKEGEGGEHQIVFEQLLDMDNRGLDRLKLRVQRMWELYANHKEKA